MNATAEQTGIIELLDTDDEEEVIELFSSDDEDDIVEVICLSEEQEPDVSSITAAPSATTQQQSQKQQNQQHKKKMKKKKKTKQNQKQQNQNHKKKMKKKKKTKQKQTQHQQQLHKKQQLMLRQQQQGQQIITMYVDGSRRMRLKKQLQMAAGIWVANGALSIARILQGGKPDSIRAELGSMYAAMDFLSTFGLPGLMGPAAEAAARAAAHTVQVWIYWDCQAGIDMLRNSCNVKEKYRPLVTAIKQLKAQLPFTVRFYKIQAHIAARDAHVVGNRHADKLARKCSEHEPVCQLPH